MTHLLLLISGVMIFLFLTGSVVGEISDLTNLKSGLLVFAGTLICAFLAFPAKTFRGLLKSLYQVFRYDEKGEKDLLFQVETLAHIRWLYGIRELEEEAKRADNAFLRKGIELVVDDYDRNEINEIMERDFELYFSKKMSELNILNTLAKLAPAFGFVGTIIGLIGVLNNMQNPEEIGKGMSLALLTTLYGSLISYFLFLPLAKKLSEHARVEAIQLNIIKEGVMDISEKKNPKAISHRLQSYLAMDHLTGNLGFGSPNPPERRLSQTFIHKLKTKRESV